MPRAIGDDELGAVGGEEAIGDIDGDALFALGGEPIDEQREIDVLALCADALAVGFERAQLVIENLFRIIEQPADQRRLAIIDRAAGDDAQQVFGLLGRQIGVDIGSDQRIRGKTVHQKYPSCFFFSMLAA